jgi:hypothetical protein
MAAARKPQGQGRAAREDQDLGAGFAKYNIAKWDVGRLIDRQDADLREVEFTPRAFPQGAGNGAPDLGRNFGRLFTFGECFQRASDCPINEGLVVWLTCHVPILVHTPNQAAALNRARAISRRQACRICFPKLAR